ncbi:MAG: hypothetical protein ABSD20_16815 [Terriglobales bacterium]|jgi:hypothetical protein
MNSNEPDVTLEQRSVRNPEVTYDRTDLSARGVVMFLLFMGVGGFVILASMWGAYRYMAGHYAARHQNSIVRFQREDPASQFPAPRLQPDPIADWNTFRWRENEILNAPAGVDPATGRKHIPIQQAIEEVAATGLPVLSADVKLDGQQRDAATQRKTK